MERALTAEQTRELESRAMHALGVDVSALMRMVGEEVARVAADLAPQGKIAVVAGAGNNAGDGWVAANVLHQAGRDVALFAISEPEELPDPARGAATEATKAGVLWSKPASAADLVVGLGAADLVVDALFGFGVHGALREPYASAAEAISDADAIVLSVDLPSGVESDTGRVVGAAVSADHTLAVLSLKVAHVQEPGRSLAGIVHVANLGVPARALDEPGALEVWDAEAVSRVLPVAAPADHKGSRGRVLVIGGSEGMTGAVALAGWGALRTGAGFVTLAVPASLVDIVDEAVLPAVVLPLGEGQERALTLEALAGALEAVAQADAVVLGPGLGASPEARELAREIVASCQAPLVIDADALNALSDDPSPLSVRKAVTVLTPHPGEAGRLLGIGTAVVQEDRLDAARRLAGLGATIVLKGAGTLVASSERMAVVTTGTPALATMGTGDVLAGALGALLASGADPFEAAYAAAHVHGAAGVLAADELTEAGVTALDVAHALPAALRNVSGQGR